MLTGRGLIVALVTCVLALLLVLSLTQTRHIGQWSDWGLFYYSRAGRMAHFGFWFPLLLTMGTSIPFAYVFGNRLYTPGAWRGGVMGMALGCLIALVLTSVDPRKHPIADRNHQIIGMFLGACIGAAAGAEIAGRIRDRRRRFSDELENEKDLNQ